MRARWVSTVAGLIANQWLLSDAWDLPAGPWGSLLYVLPISLWEGVVFGLVLAVLSRFPEQPTPTTADVATALPEPAA